MLSNKNLSTDLTKSDKVLTVQVLTGMLRIPAVPGRLNTISPFISPVAMANLPNTLEEAVAQAQTATQAAIAAGYGRLQIELLLPELKPLPVALQYLSLFAEYGSDLKVFFSDAGAAALAKRDWGDVTFQIASLDVAGSRQTTPVEDLVSSSDRAFVFVAPTAVEVLVAEQVCDAAGDRPVVLLNPRLEDMSIVGIGYTARQIRNRFLNTFEPCYYLRPLEGAVLFRCYPTPWQVLQETEEGYTLLAEELLKPSGEQLEQIFLKATSQQPRTGGFLIRMQRFLRALGQ